jgi:hypothetical protein
MLRSVCISSFSKLSLLRSRSDWQYSALLDMQRSESQLSAVQKILLVSICNVTAKRHRKTLYQQVTNLIFAV